ncbi:hypothetical protein BDV98DRAFT_578312 [Pterulicium gracile]|uniref:Uncharacterized protein n=1 Tax=Pterulicium gracile TaxID=1884261 RepID=A0A5C3Q3Z8_9AGAR|nr:hypothetical protein BDV98DRAFT_578312 [Pterula gracilis]
MRSITGTLENRREAWIETDNDQDTLFHPLPQKRPSSSSKGVGLDVHCTHVLSLLVALDHHLRDPLLAMPGCSSNVNPCTHAKLLLDTPSPFAAQAGYTRPTAQQRASAAMTSASTKNRPSCQPSTTFPAPLVLPDDDLALDSSYPPQSLRSWVRNKDRNEVTEDRRTIYVAAPPEVSADVGFMNDWCSPQFKARKEVASGVGSVTNAPSTEDVVDYLRAFCHGVPVKLTPADVKLRYTAWEDDSGTTKNQPSYIGLASSTDSCVRIRVRHRPSSLYPHQLNLDDLLDATIDILPPDAYALLLLTSHDLYEDDDDDFACGRAYGGSRVAVVSMARYDPGLDRVQGVDRVHSWPASCCAVYVEECCGETTKQKKRRKRDLAQPDLEARTEHSAMHAAVSAFQRLSPYTHTSQPATSESECYLRGLWLGRVCRTASHELGHCFGIDHCVYYACVMQGTAGLGEDARQPPYLCPVDEAKVLRAIDGAKLSSSTSKFKLSGSIPGAKLPSSASGPKEAWRVRDKKLRAFCAKWKELEMFGAFGAWLDVRLAKG